MKPSPTWVKFYRKLKREFPVDKPVRVEFVPGLDALAYSFCDGKRYIIELKYRSCLWQMRHDLLHEWAHIRAGWPTGRSPHTNKWGVEYARIYRYMCAGKEWSD